MAWHQSAIDFSFYTCATGEGSWRTIDSVAIEAIVATAAREKIAFTKRVRLNRKLQGRSLANTRDVVCGEARHDELHRFRIHGPAEIYCLRVIYAWEAKHHTDAGWLG
jgi:hypothetical protein